MKLLVLHGPNMNLFGIRSSKVGKRITLDKINRSIRRFIRGKNIEIKIFQTHSEVKAVAYLHSNRNKYDGLVLTPGVWQDSGYILKDTLDIISMKYVIIKIDKTETINLFSGNKNIFNEDIIKSYADAISYYVSK